jgi:hypothetical protein
MKHKQTGILCNAYHFTWIAPAVAQQVEPPYDPAILPQGMPALPSLNMADTMANSGAARLNTPFQSAGPKGMARGFRSNTTAAAATA